MKKDIKKIISLPKGTEIKITDGNIILKKDGHENEHRFKIAGIKVSTEQDSIVLEKKKANKKDKRLINALASHILNSAKGFDKLYEYKLQICTVHFPMTAKVEGNKFVIKNFLGERKDRVLEIDPRVKVRIENDIVIVDSASKELAGQQASRIEGLTRVRARDRRVFQDGIWIIKKEKGRHKKHE